MTAFRGVPDPEMPKSKKECIREMTTSKNTKRALLSSVLAMVLCAAMLIGTTFAWFTDRVTSGANKIVAGNLDIALSYQNANMTAFAEVEPGTDDLFVAQDGGEILWEPGAAAVTYLKLENVGSLALKYELSASAVDTVIGNDGAALSKVLKTAVVEIAEDAVGTYTRDSAIAAAEAAGAENVLEYSKAADMAADAGGCNGHGDVRAQALRYRSEGADDREPGGGRGDRRGERREVSARKRLSQAGYGGCRGNHNQRGCDRTQGTGLVQDHFERQNRACQHPLGRRERHQQNGGVPP